VLNGRYNRVQFWDSKYSGIKRLAVNSKFLVIDESGGSRFRCKFLIGQNVFHLIQRDEDNFDLLVDKKEFSVLMALEKSGKLKALLKQQQQQQEKVDRPVNNPMEDLDKLVNKQLQKERIEEKKKNESKKDVKVNLNDEDEFDFLSPSEINKIKQNLNRTRSLKNKEAFIKNQNILQNIDVFGDNKNPKEQNLEYFKKNSNMIGLDFFTGDLQNNNNNNNNNQPINNNINNNYQRENNSNFNSGNIFNNNNLVNNSQNQNNIGNNNFENNNLNKYDNNKDSNNNQNPNKEEDRFNTTPFDMD